VIESDESLKDKEIWIGGFGDKKRLMKISVESCALSCGHKEIILSRLENSRQKLKFSVYHFFVRIVVMYLLPQVKCFLVALQNMNSSVKAVV